MVTIGEKFIERTQKALVETAILGELNRDGDLTREELIRRVRNVGFQDEKLIRDCIKRLDRDGHLREQGDRLQITQDGREDIRRIEGQLCCVAAAEVSGVDVPAQYRPGTFTGGIGGPVGP